jgi:hypothetical protein
MLFRWPRLIKVDVRDLDDAITASGSSFAEPKPAADLPSTQTSGFAAASGVNR